MVYSDEHPEAILYDIEEELCKSVPKPIDINVRAT
jgi:hypothetical protein